MSYKELDGYPTPWAGQHTPWWRRMIYKLYVKYVNSPFIPKGAKIHLSKYPGVAKRDGIETMKIIHRNGFNNDTDYYVFNQYNEITIWPKK